MSFLEHFAHPHWPNLALIAQQSLVIKIHLLTALAALIIGTLQVFGPKGTTIHRILGWSWVLILAITAFSSLFIRNLSSGMGGFSLILILSVFTLAALPRLVLAARRHDIKAHKRHALTLYFGALIIAGVFTFLPGRLMWQVFFG